MVGHVVRRWRIGLPALCVALIALPASSAMADGSSSAADIIIGPLKMHHGFSVTIDAYQCGQKFQGISVGYVKGGRGYSLDHYYGGPANAGGCKAAAKTLSRGSAHARWGKLLNMSLSFGHAGALRNIKPSPGCSGSFGHYRLVKGTGRLKLAIHAGAFGKLNLSHVKAEIERFSGKYNCHQPPAPQFALQASYTTGDVSASLMPSGERTLLFYSAGADKPGKGVNGTVEAEFTSRSSSLFSAQSNLSSAKVGGMSPYLTGGLSFTGNSTCPTNANVESGSIAGRLTLHDPVGTFTLGGSSPSPATLTKGANYYCTA